MKRARERERVGLDAVEVSILAHARCAAPSHASFFGISFLLSALGPDNQEEDLGVFSLRSPPSLIGGLSLRFGGDFPPHPLRINPGSHTL